MCNVFSFPCSHQDEIKDICSSASRQLELEVKMRSTEEEWTEQVRLTRVLAFEW